MPGRDVSRPGVDRPLQGAVSVRERVNATLTVIPVDRVADVAVAQLGQGVTLAQIVLAAVLCQAVDHPGMPADEGSQGPARADRAHLMVVADGHEFGPGGLHPGREGDQVGVFGHADFVQNEDGALVEGEPPLVEPPQQAGRCSGLPDLCCSQRH